MGGYQFSGIANTGSDNLTYFCSKDGYSRLVHEKNGLAVQSGEVLLVTSAHVCVALAHTLELRCLYAYSNCSPTYTDVTRME